MRTIRIKVPSMEQVEFILEADYCDIPVRGNALASGDDAADKACEDEIIRRVNDGDIWAWAYVTVTAKWRDMEGRDSLGCCSYEDEEDFKADGYYDDMKQMAYADLIKKIERLA